MMNTYLQCQRTWQKQLQKVPSVESTTHFQAWKIFTQKDNELSHERWETEALCAAVMREPETHWNKENNKSAGKGIYIYATGVRNNEGAG